MKPFTEFFFSENTVLSNESWFWFSEYAQDSFVMYSEEEFRENIVTLSSATAPVNYGQFIIQRSSFTYSTTREYEKIDSILSYMVGNFLK